MTHPRVTKAIFPVGGLGTRFLPATKAIPKEMLPVLDKPLIQYAVEEALASGIEEIIFVTGKGKTAIEDHFDRAFELETLLARSNPKALAALKKLQLPPGSVAYVRQQEPLGLGHAIWCARHLVRDEPFAVLLADDFILSERPPLAQLLEQHAQFGGHWATVMSVPPSDTSRYGILDIASQDGAIIKVKGLVEKPLPEKAPSTTAIVGRYILSPTIFPHLEAKISSTPTGEIQITDAIAASFATDPFYGLVFEGDRFDCGTLPGMFEATVAAARLRADLAGSLFTQDGMSVRNSFTR